MDILLYPLFSVGCLILFFCCFRIFRESPFWGTAWVLFLVLTFLYDNLILTFGRWIGFGDTLETLSLIRYLLHVLLIPTLVFVALDFLRRAQVSWVEGITSRVLFHLYTLVLTVIGIFHDFLWVQLESISINGIDRYVIGDHPFSIALVLAIIPLFITSLAVWRRLECPILFFGFIFIMLLEVIAFFLESYAIGSFTELVLMSFLVLTEYRLKQEDYTSNLFEA
jgi:hypothetical protein